MTNNVADHHPGNSVAEGNHEGDFGCSMVELRNLMELRSAEAVARLNDSYGGVHNVCKRLKTSPVEGIFEAEKEEGEGEASWQGLPRGVARSPTSPGRMERRRGEVRGEELLGCQRGTGGSSPQPGCCSAPASPLFNH
ncbi:hypothetical protein BTVI_04000 [Pitangus sulphuratus]|nr:hypothetical protein BTVI_04000 [Pitangus sulphuratus]